VTPAAAQALPSILIWLAFAAIASFALTPVAARIAARAGAMDLPGAARRVHARPIPRAGGLAVVAAFVGVGLLAVLANEQLRSVPVVGIGPDEYLGLFGGAAIGAAFGFVDDKLQLKARWQLGSQLALALVALVTGITITFISNPFGPNTIVFSLPFELAFSAVWIVGMVNSLNFIDGLDGLSSGIALIAATTLGILSLVQTPAQPMVALLCAVLAGSLLGFLPWNFHPARVFIGTTGVFAVGYALAVLSILGTAKVAVALLVLGVPIIDTFWIIVRRLLQGQSPFTPDRGHFHHRLLDLGLTHRGAVLLIYAITGALAVLSLVLSNANQLYTFVGIVVIGGLLLYLMTRRAQESFDPGSYPDDHTGRMRLAGRGRPRDQARPVASEAVGSHATQPAEAKRPEPATHDAR
jgi:UDP-GlcNAc:undecaprenyl-phosphate GlcNAc-1-phosphate transferase